MARAAWTSLPFSASMSRMSASRMMSRRTLPSAVAGWSAGLNRIRMGLMPKVRAAAAVCMHQLDWRPAQVMTTSAFFSSHVPDDELELARLVAAEGQARQVVALDVDLRPAQPGREPLELAQGGRAVDEVDAGEPVDDFENALDAFGP